MALNKETGQYLPPPGLDEPLATELKRIAELLAAPRPNFIVLGELNAAPPKFEDGMMVYADGANWNPDGVSGRGYYRYEAGGLPSPWKYLG
jgi:hypothetical protein